jgi:hypothetical protein
MNLYNYIKLAKSYSYTVPADRQQQIVDFYLLTAFYNQDVQAETEDIALQDSFDNATQIICSFLRQDIMDVIYFGCTTELSHLQRLYDAYDKTLSYSKDNSYYEERLSELADQLETIFMILNKHGYATDMFVEAGQKYRNSDDVNLGDTFGELNKLFDSLYSQSGDPNEFMSLALDLFSQENLWPPAFGGKAYVPIVEAWFQLRDANNIGEQIIAIDHAFDLEHNTGSIFTKAESWGDGEEFGWIQDILSYKRNSTNLWELYNYASDSLKPMIAKVIYNMTGQSQELYVDKEDNSDEEILTADPELPNDFSEESYNEWFNSTFKQ